MRGLGPVFISAAVVAVLLTGCKGSGPNADTTGTGRRDHAAPGGWAEVKCAGVSISLPSGMDIDDKTKSGDLQSSDKTGGHLKLLAKSQAAGAGGFHNNFNLIVLAIPKGSTEQSLLKSNKAALERHSVAGSVVAKIIKLKLGDTLFFQEERARQSSENLAVTTYMLLHAGQMYLFTFASGQADKDAWRSVAEAAMKTVSFEPG